GNSLIKKRRNRPRPLRSNAPGSIISNSRGGNLEQRLQRLDEELGRLDDSQLLSEITALEADENRQKGEADTLHGQLDQAVELINQQREKNSQTANSLDQARADFQSKKGRLASLEALQQASLGQQDEGVEWLEKRQLSDAKRLAQEIKVEPRWQQAVELVLGFHLQAVCVDDIGRFNEQLAQLEKGGLAFWDTRARTGDEYPPARTPCFPRLHRPGICSRCLVV
ncbi:MAG: hypothetical protein AB2533_15195, partial [Candidatus Thiodiazotropha endolucinida]